MGGGQLLERDAVLAAIGELVAGARTGRGGALFVVGEAGLGKTTCVSQAIAMASSGVQVGLGRGDVMETSLPFGVFTAALGEMGNRDLLTVPASGARPEDVRAARFYGVQRWLQDVSGPVLLALDDLHWADPDSMALLSFLSRRLTGLPVAVLGTLRPWPLEAYELVGALVHDGYASVQRLAPLSADAAATLLSTQLGGSLPEAVSRAAARLCTGNPLLLEQVAMSLRQREPATPLSGFDASIGADRIVLTRFAGLPPAALDTARAASVLGTRFHPALATKVARVPEHQTATALSALCRSGLVRAETATRAEFVHPLFGQSLYHDIAAPIRARLHARAFTVLCAHGLETEAVEHAIRADLVGDPAAIEVVERAGRAAMAAGATDTAVNRLRAAVRLAGDRAGSALLLALGEALLLGGRPAEVIELHDRVSAAADLGPGDRVRMLQLLGRALFITVGYRHAAQRYAEAAVLAEACGETTVAEVLLDDAVACLFILGPSHALPLATRAYEMTRTAPVPLRRWATGVWGLITWLTGDPAGLVASESAARELMSSSAEPYEVGLGPLSGFAIAAGFAERFTDADHVLAVAVAAGERLGAAEMTAMNLFVKAALAIRRGRLADALVAAEKASSYAELMPYSAGAASCAKAEILLLTGRLDECAVLCQRVEAIASTQEESIYSLHWGHVRAQLLHYSGDHAGACALYQHIEQQFTRMGIAEPCMAPWARHALLAYLASGRLADVRGVIDWLECGAARLPCRWPRIVAAVGRAVVAEAEGDLGGAEQHYRAALALHAQVELLIDQVETLLGYGGFLRRHGQPTRARPHLAHALEIAGNCGASLLADQARAELAIAGGRRRRAPTDPTQLTAQEQRVARLAAAGHSNKAIAGELCLSPKTVEYHLARIYTKLGLTSRRELMADHYDVP